MDCLSESGVLPHRKVVANMKWIHVPAFIALEIFGLLLLAGMPHVGGPLLVLALIGQLVYAAFTGKQSNDGIR